jgi:peptidoglycan/LPS O-acetylase OafA/YrhL
VFLPNIAFNLHRAPAATEQLWSIGVEEQFYALWPVIVSRIKRLARFLVFLILALVFVRGVLKIYSDHVHNKLAFSIVADMRFDCMATGALFAIGYERRNPRLIKLAKTWLAPIAFWSCFLLALSRHFTAFSILGDNVVAIATGLFIVSQIESSRRVTLLENPVLSFLGQISYGLYVYHPLVIVMLGRLFRHWNSVPANTVVALVTVALMTIAVAAASYAVLERPFLKLKDRFQSDPAIVK